MLDLLDAPDHVAAFALSGTLTEDDLDRVIDQIESRLDRHDRIAVLADLTGLRDVTVRAGINDLRYGLGKLGELRRFAREALVTDSSRLACLARLSALFIPFIAIRTFTPDEREAALGWAGDIDGRAAA